GMVERILSNRMGTGTAAALSYAYRIEQVPNWVLVSAVMTLMLPNFAAALHRDDLLSCTDMARRALVFALGAAVPSAVLLAVWARPLLSLLFQHGSFGPESVALTARILSTYGWAVVSQCWAAVLFRLTAASGRLRWSSLAALTATAVNVGFDLAFAPALGPQVFGAGACLWGFTASGLLWIPLRRTVSLRPAPKGEMNL
ncbi:MAG: hypothetical protein K6T30_09735, partial [Alicyclobacillus sp.]|nr:hypothetical protein [Alicyclobacillus sp.]